jgi:FimV-like protein
MQKRFIFAIATALMVFSPSMWALGLGESKVLSFLNQPLRVHIDLITRPSDDLDSITASLASADDFELVGASLAAISVPLEFSIEEENGDAYILVTSDVSVADPLVRIIVEVNWSSGRMLREYTLFLDPATHQSAAPAPVIESAPARQSRPGRTVTDTPPEPERPIPSADDEYGPVRSGDTLWRIASDWSSGGGHNLNQVMLAIQQKNPEAFINGNINLLRQGVTLQLPDEGEVRRLSASEASAEVQAQSADISNREVESAADLPLFAEESTQVEDDADTAVEPSADDRLELVPPQEGSADQESGGEGQAGSGPESLREELARTEEELIAQQQENEYLQQRIDELESQVSSEGTVDGADPAAEGSIADTDLSGMEDRLKEERNDVPSVSTGEQESGAWYANLTLWIIVILIGGVIGAVLYFRRREPDSIYISDLGQDEDAVKEIIDEAEDIQRMLKTSDESDTGEEAGGVDTPAEEPLSESDRPLAKVSQFPPSDSDATILSEESADPEIKLDLARAYISMGDKEAARAILDEVIEHGNEEQQTEARSMKEGL